MFLGSNLMPFDRFLDEERLATRNETDAEVEKKGEARGHHREEIEGFAFNLSGISVK